MQNNNNDKIILQIAEDSAATRTLLETHLNDHHDRSFYTSLASVMIAFAAFFSNMFKGS